MLKIELVPRAIRLLQGSATGFLLLAPTAFADILQCYSEYDTCTAQCMSSAINSGARNAIGVVAAGAQNLICTSTCDNTRTACVAREEARAQAERAEREATQRATADRQRQQATEAKSDADARVTVQRADELAKRTAAEIAIKRQYDAAMEKGIQALDSKGWLSAEHQFRQALKVKPNDIEAAAWLTHTLLAGNRRAAAYSFANEQMLAFAATEPARGENVYTQWLAALVERDVLNAAEQSALAAVYPHAASGDPLAAAASFRRAYPKSPYTPFIDKLSAAMPAMLAEAIDKRANMEAARVKREAVAAAKAQADEIAAKAKAQADEERRLAPPNRLSPKALGLLASRVNGKAPLLLACGRANCGHGGLASILQRAQAAQRKIALYAGPSAREWVEILLREKFVDLLIYPFNSDLPAKGALVEFSDPAQLSLGVFTVEQSARWIERDFTPLVILGTKREDPLPNVPHLGELD